MKNLIYIGFFLLAVVFTGCQEDLDTEGVSRVTTFPTFELTDGASVVITTGTSFTPDAMVTEGDTQLTPTIVNGVDNATPGIYTVTYSAENSDGFPGTSSQQVIVYDPAIVATDVSGNIADIGRPERKGVISLVPGTTNIFFGTDMGFGGVFPLYFQMDGDVMTAIPQTLAFGQTSVDATYDPVARTFAITINPAGFSYNFQYE
ncbi:MAG: immunoglobulin-like domain-containing protein [Reichenbachiella sp.]|uniref:immunoglobulin-like domain-containing protein n=1 Tax=Reichenbachiella sp. TaxID=2184521 RepID=UPI0032630C24